MNVTVRIKKPGYPEGLKESYKNIKRIKQRTSFLELKDEDGNKNEIYLPSVLKFKVTIGNKDSDE